MTDVAAFGPRWRRWGRWGGALVGIAALAWVLRGLDLQRLLATVAGADIRFLVLVPIAIAAGELVRAWKWRQLLSPLAAVGTLRLFGAIMVGYLADLVIPLGFGPLVRSWLVARRADLKASAVLATVVIDRLIDGVVLVGFVVVALTSVAFPDPTGDIRLGLIWGGAGGLLVFPLLLVVLARYKRDTARTGSRLLRIFRRLPLRLGGPAERLLRSFAEGIVWPHAWWRRLGIALASVVIRLIAATHFLWAGLALGVVLRPAEYVFVMVFLGFLIVLTRFVHLAGGFVIGAVFVLGLFGVAKEEALAMALIVTGGNLLSIAGIGAAAMSREGVALGELRKIAAEDADRR